MTVGPADAFAQIDEERASAITEGPAFGEVRFNACAQGWGEDEEAFILGFHGGRDLYDVPGDGAAEFAAVGANLLKGDDDAWVVG